MRNVRVFFKKKGNMKFVSHLDMNRFMIRMVRMSGIPVWYSEGFNPHPYLTFALPLSLGFESEYDIMDFRVNDDEYPNSEIIKRLRELMPAGIELISCCDPIMKTGDIAYADFYIEFGDAFAQHIKNFEDFLSSERIETEKKTKKGGVKTVDIKEFIKSYSLSETGINITLAAGGSNNLNPKLLLDAFENKFQTSLPPYSVTRQNLYNSHMLLFK